MSQLLQVHIFSFLSKIWNDSDKLEDVTSIVYDHIESVYHENSPERIYFLILL